VRTTVITRKQTSLLENVSATGTTLYVRDADDMPTVPWLAILSPESPSPEIVLVTANNITTTPVSDNIETLTIVRGAMGTTAVAHKRDATLYECGQKTTIRGLITDISTAESIYLPMPKGFLLRVGGILEGTIATADAIITVTKNATTLGTVTVAYASSDAGDWDEMLADGDAIADFFFDGVDDFLLVATGGQSTETMRWEFMVEYIPY